MKKSRVEDILKEKERADSYSSDIEDINTIDSEGVKIIDLTDANDTEDDNELIVKLLRLDDNIVKEPTGAKAYKVFSNRIKATIFFDKIESEADKKLKEAQIETLKTSIARREKLLSNENYVNKAPSNIVEKDKKKLEEEKKKLEELTK